MIDPATLSMIVHERRRHGEPLPMGDLPVTDEILLLRQEEFQRSMERVGFALKRAVSP